MEHGAGHGLREDVVHVDGGDAHLLVTSSQDSEAEFAVVPVVWVQGDVEGDPQGQVLIVLHLVGGVVFRMVDLPIRDLFHG